MRKREARAQCTSGSTAVEGQNYLRIMSDQGISMRIVKVAKINPYDDTSACHSPNNTVLIHLIYIQTRFPDPAQ